MHKSGYKSYRFLNAGLRRVLTRALLVVCLFGAWYLEAHESAPAIPPALNEAAVNRESPQAAMHMHGSHGMIVAPRIHIQPRPAPHSHHAGEDTEPAQMHFAGAAAHHHAASTPAASLVLFLLLVTLAIAAGLTLSARHALRHGISATGSTGMNLLGRPLIGKFLRSRHFLTLLVAPTMLVFAFIVLAGLLGEQSTGNPAVLLTWILWWPAVIVTFFLLGRIWCAACPFGYLGDLAQKIYSFKWKVPRILRNMWWRSGFFVALTWATTLWTLDRWPRGTAWLALGVTLGAMALAVLYEKRAFCRYVCPVGGVFGLYSMTAPLRLGVKDRKVCQQECSEKNCYQACAWFQFPPTLDRNAECSLCLDCVRACPHDNITLQTQPFGADLAQFQTHRKSLDEASAIAVVLGVALLQTMVMLNGWMDWETRIGSWLHIAPGRLLYTILFVSVGVIAPVLLLSLVTYFSLPREQALGDFFLALRTYAYCFLPLGLALHAAHNFHHLFGEGGAMWSGLKRAVAQYAGWTSLASAQDAAASLGPNTLFVLQWVALIAGLYLAFRVGVALVRRNGSPPERAFRAAVPILLFATAFTVLNLVVLSAAMGHRH